MSPGDLVRIKDDVVWMFHDSGLGAYTLAGSGELVVVLSLDEIAGRYGLFARVLHPDVGVCYIRGCRLEVVDDTTTTLRPATR